MSLIICPECGKEISDKATSCVHCGATVIKQHSITKKCGECGEDNPFDAKLCSKCGCPFEDNEPKKKVVNSASVKKIVIPIIVVVVILIVVGIIYVFTNVKPRNTYNEAISLLEKGKYEEADKLFETLDGYEDVDVIREQLKYESYSYSAINSLKKILKNPDSFQPYEIVFYNSIGSTDQYMNDLAGAVTSKDSEDHPVCVIYYGAQNGFGGNTTSYSIFSYNSSKEEYSFIGSCDSLDEKKYDEKDDDDKYDLIVCRIINLYKDGNDTIGSIDMSRLKNILKNDAYSTIKIID